MTARGSAPAARRLAHARPITVVARRRADRAGVAYGGRGARRWPVPWLAAGAIVVVLLAVIGGTLASGGPGFGLPAGAGRSTGSPSAAAIAPSAEPSSSAASAASSVAPTVQPSGLPTGYRWPLDHARITSWFGPMSNEPFLVDGQSFHDGIDLASFCGDHVTAAHDGVVLVAGRRVDEWLGWVGSYAPHVARLDAKNLWSSLAIVVITDDGNGYRSVYMHLGKALVTAGQQVHAGQLIGYEGRTGNATGCHLHFSIFNPTETAIFETAPAAITRWALPPAEIARIDPLLVLPPMASVDVTWGWGAKD